MDDESYLIIFKLNPMKFHQRGDHYIKRQELEFLCLHNGTIPEEFKENAKNNFEYFKQQLTLDAVRNLKIDDPKLKELLDELEPDLQQHVALEGQGAPEARVARAPQGARQGVAKPRVAMEGSPKSKSFNPKKFFKNLPPIPRKTPGKISIIYK